MLASSDSDRWYSASIAFSARSISRIAYQTVATTITAEPMTELMKPTVSIHGGPRPLSLGTKSSRAIDPGRTECHDRRRQNDALDPEHEEHQGRRDQEVELQT